MNENRKIRVLMFMTNLEDLGIQKVFLNLYKHMPTKIEPTIVFWRKDGRMSHLFESRGKVYVTDEHSLPLKSIFRIFKYLSTIYKEKPDIILSFTPGTNVSIALLKPFIPFIPLVASEHAYISKAFETGEYPGIFGKIYKSMIPYMYNRIFDKLIMVANVAKQDATKKWKIDENRIEVIYNPQDVEDITNRSLIGLDDEWFMGNIPVIIGAGRLAPQKGFDKLIEAFSILVKKRKAKLVIVGRGNLEKKLKAQCEKYSIEDQVKFLGFKPNILKYFRSSSIFALSSVWEAMPMVVAEALVVGIPIVSFDCPSGPRELLDDGTRGYLVEDQNVEALAKTLEYVMDNYQEALEKAEQGKKWAKENLGVDKISSKYTELLESLLKKH